ncbi:c-type cytochrome [Cognatishimia activa]|uniref:Putative bifunctional cbb3-type cytochrome c oxidase subunit II/cytochrome c n=1 Tax=Cognatishimia activa TaxID=1715691 RepID=A0A0P1ITQ3_9RHOB|nr:cytochrome c [Cognatishimia activa]CUJ38047.1 putative bifunctional cbb3-type cytochrome c oxidase subunit II/cytochrome c [Cognatishimia activa]CUK26945.1 putative bifunctional cbb3-type cytochrome c oxidase subunit II/cytochrome c [Cognatishimia activa]
MFQRDFLTVLFFGFATGASAGHELDDRDLSNGQTLYAEQCASCHGVNLEGQPNWQTPNDNGIRPAPPHDATGHTWHHDNQLLFEYTQLGGEAALVARGIDGFKSGMPGFGDALTEDDIWDILAFIRSTWPERVQKIQANRNPPHR